MFLHSYKKKDEIKGWAQDTASLPLETVCFAK